LVIANTLALSWVFYLGWLISGVLIFRIYIQIRDKDRLRCFKAFLFNNYIGMVLFIGIALDYGLKLYAH
jgi:4-hydroxybenzoate polyprenyltransferase